MEKLDFAKKEEIVAINKWLKLSTITGAVLGAALAMAGNGLATNAIVQKNCAKCHQPFTKMDNVVAGNLESRSIKAKSMSVQVGETVHIIKFTKDTTVKNVPAIKNMKKPLPVLVAYKQVGKDRVAVHITAKPVIKVPENQLVDVKQVMALVKSGQALLVDSRPPAHFHAGHIPGAVSIPFPKMPEMMGKFPKDKNKQVVFYCEGFR